MKNVNLMMPKNYDLKGVEKKWQDTWEVENIYRFNFNSSKPTFSIDNPPRYASGALHIGHAVHYAHIDFIARYKRLFGYNVFFPLCFDVNGMPIEVNVEKKYKISPKDISRSEFTKMCGEFANKNISTMTNQFKILGCSMDPTLYYQTDAEYYRRITQISFLKMLEKDLVYKAKHPVNWCTRCITALGDAEIEYYDRETKLNYIKFYVDGPIRESGAIRKDQRGCYVVVATTRPELIPTCQIVAVNPGDTRYKSLDGMKLITPIFRRKVNITQDNKVEKDFGTGIVMICSIGDKEDLEFIYNYDLKFEKAIDEEGKMTSICGIYEGMSTIEARAKIIQDLHDKDLLVERESISQSVGTCWRCHTPVEFLVKDQWFVKLLPFKEKVKNAARKIKWHPDWMKVRLHQWVDSLSWDWVISRQRYFATPIPIWVCVSCKKIVPAKIEQCYVDPLEDKPPIAFCPDCGGKLKGSEEVFDTWMDSSISALYNTFWHRDKELFKKLYPMTIRTQAHDIIRTWAFYSILRNILITEDIPWKNIFIDGHILAPDGKAMHASWGNTIDPLEILDEHGADAMRYFAATRGLGEDSAFSWKEITHATKFINKLYNMGRFIESASGEGKITIIDRWIASEFALVAQKVEKSVNNYQFASALRDTESFLWHVFADNYLEMIKYRLYQKELPSQFIKQLFIDALKLVAPIIVHMTEEINSHIMGEKSIHLSEWPKNYNINKRALSVGRTAGEIISEIRRWKSQKGIPLNKEIQKVRIHSQENLEEVLNDIKTTLNILELELSREMPDIKETIIGITPDFSKIGPVFGKDTKNVVKLLSKSETVKELLEKDEAEIEGYKLKREYILKIDKEFETKGKKVELIENPEFLIEIS
ncbi:MAG: valine--tRNA ligase [Candidatus Methanofastidiosia archaeon]